MRDYKINEYHVAENPERIDIFKDRKVLARIYVATNGEWWARGHRFKIYGARVGSGENAGLPAFSKYNMKYQSRHAAIQDAIEYGIQYFQDTEKHYPGKFPLKAVLRELKKARTPQLKLF